MTNKIPLAILRTTAAACAMLAGMGAAVAHVTLRPGGVTACGRCPIRGILPRRERSSYEPDRLVILPWQIR